MSADTAVAGFAGVAGVVRVCTLPRRVGLLFAVDREVLESPLVAVDVGVALRVAVHAAELVVDLADVALAGEGGQRVVALVLQGGAGEVGAVGGERRPLGANDFVACANSAPAATGLPSVEAARGSERCR